jgi:LPXTG-motif cell wall-anchored protein
MAFKHLLIFFILFMMCCGTAFGATISSAIDTSMTNQNPNPAHQGEPVELTLSVQNTGSNNLKEISVTVRPHEGSTFYPFSQLDSQPLTQKVAYLNAAQQGSDAAVLKFDLITDQNAAAGTYYVDVYTTAKEDTDASNEINVINTIPIVIKGKEYAQIVSVNKANIDAGKQEPLEFVITNTGSAPLQNMVVSWNDPRGVIFPIYSDNTKYINYLAANQSAKVDYYVMADVNANPGLYYLNVTLSFENYNSNETTIRTTTGVFVGGPTDFDASYSESVAGQVSIAVANIGNNMADAVKVSIPQQNGYRVSGSPSTIIGNLQKGDYTIASFNISSVNNTTSPLKVQIDYTDPQGNRLTENKEVIVPAGNAFTSTGRQRATATSSSSNTWLYLVILVMILIVVGYFYYKKKKGGKEEIHNSSTE